MINQGEQLSVNEQEIKLLEQISNGVMIFEPYLRTSAELIKFQVIARNLLKLEAAGLVHKCYVTEAEIAGTVYYDLIQCPRGLTPDGEEVLRTKTPEEKSAK